jgi:hypothetical protein
MWQASTLNMEWCLGCHRAPQDFVRPREAVFDPDYVPPAHQAELGRELVERYHIETRESCATCHR